MSKEDIALLFLTWSGLHYEETKKKMKTRFNKLQFDNKSYKEYFNDDNFHACLVKTHDNILERGFKFKNNCVTYSGESFSSFLYIALRNELYVNTKQENLLSHDNDFENLLTFDGESLENEHAEKIRENEIINQVYRYVDTHYTFIQSAIFQHYFKTNYSYRKLSKINGYGVSFIQNTIKAIADDVKDKFNFNLPGRKK